MERQVSSFQKIVKQTLQQVLMIFWKPVMLPINVMFHSILSRQQIVTLQTSIFQVSVMNSIKMNHQDGDVLQLCATYRAVMFQAAEMLPFNMILHSILDVIVQETYCPQDLSTPSTSPMSQVQCYMQPLDVTFQETRCPQDLSTPITSL